MCEININIVLISHNMLLLRGHDFACFVDSSAFINNFNASYWQFVGFGMFCEFVSCFFFFLS